MYKLTLGQSVRMASFVANSVPISHCHALAKLPIIAACADPKSLSEGANFEYVFLRIQIPLLALRASETPFKLRWADVPMMAQWCFTGGPMMAQH